MQSTALTAIFLPIAIAIVMLGLGLALTVDDFRRVMKFPKAVFIGLICQMVILPLAAFGIAKVFALPGPLAVGLMLLAASPGGSTANLFSHLAKGDVALNISLTAVNSALSLFTLPFIVNFALAHFIGTEHSIPLQLKSVIELFVIVLGPASIGMLIRSKKKSLADALEKPVRIISALVLLLIIIGIVWRERNNITTFFAQVGLPALVFNLVSMATGFFLPRLLRLERRQATAIAMEIGIHNGTLAITVATAPSLLNDSSMAIPAAVYSLIMFFTAALFGTFISRQVEREGQPTPAA